MPWRVISGNFTGSDAEAAAVGDGWSGVRVGLLAGWVRDESATSGEPLGVEVTAAVAGSGAVIGKVKVWAGVVWALVSVEESVVLAEKPFQKNHPLMAKNATNNSGSQSILTKGD